MNAIILSSDDAESITRYDSNCGCEDCHRITRLLSNGTPGYSWLTEVPDDVLEDLLNGTSTVNQGQLWCDLESEIARRDNLKSPKD